MTTLFSGLAQTVTQRTSLTMSQRQSVELLQLTGPELQTQIDAALAVNPLIEIDQNSNFHSQEPSESITFEPLACDEPAGVAHDFKEPAYLTWAASAPDDEDFDPYAKLSSAENLIDYLMREVAELRLSNEDRSLVEWLVGNLDENGFLSDSIEECARSYPESVEFSRWTSALEILQSMDPAGIGARNAVDALVLQLRRFEGEASEPLAAIAVALLTQAKDLVSKRDFKSVAKSLGYEYEDVLAAFALICTLNPHPASAFGDDIESNYVIAEVLITKTETGFKAVLNPAVIPRLKFDAESFDLLTRAKLSGEEKSQWRKKADEAKNFVRSVEQRFSTIAAVAQTIVDLQPDFFTLGPTALKPMGLKDIAARLSMAESTVSRATAGKYMQTPLGTFEFKSFFTSALAGTDGLSVSSASVRRRIVEIVAQENPQKPLSDSAIAQILDGEGIQVARRTVAKYRELEHIAPKSLRKVLG